MYGVLDTSNVMWTLRAHVAGHRPPYNQAWAPCNPRAGWMLAAGTGARLIHRVHDAVIVWTTATNYRLGALTACGKEHCVAELFREPPDNAAFCDGCLLGYGFENWGVYRTFDADGALLYIGSTNRLDLRFAAHMNTSKWWWKVRSYTFEPHPTQWETRNAEEMAIRAECPPENRPRRHAA